MSVEVKPQQLEIKDFQERVKGALIGRKVLYERIPSRNDYVKMMQIATRLRVNESIYPDKLSFLLRNNTPLSGSIATERPASAYFTLVTLNNGENEEKIVHAVIVEWGEIDSSGEAKLHNYLNHVINYPRRKDLGMTFRSGHLAKLKKYNNIHLALIDSIGGRENFTLDPSSDEFQIVRILRQNNYIILSSSGYICNIENLN